MAEVSAITAFAEPVVAQAKRMLRQRRGTHAIPGQRTEEHLRRGRGPMLLIAHADAPSDGALQAVAAALAVGNPVWIVGPATATTRWRVLADRGLDVAVHNGESAAEWYAAATHTSVATIVLDGADAPGWAPWLQLALATRATRGCLPQILRHTAKVDDSDAVFAQLLVSTIAVNTLRHGAPLVLDLPDADPIA